MPLILSCDPAAPPSCLSYPSHPRLSHLFLPGGAAARVKAVGLRSRRARRRRSRPRSGPGVGARRGGGPAPARVEATDRPRPQPERRRGSASCAGAARFRRSRGAPPASGRPVSPPLRPDPPPPARVEGRVGGQRRLDTCAGAASAHALAPPPPAGFPNRAAGSASTRPVPACILTASAGPRPSSRRRRPHRTRQQRKCYFWWKWRARAGQALQQWPAYARGTAAAAAAGGRGACQWDGRCICGRGTRRAREGRPRQ